MLCERYGTKSNHPDQRFLEVPQYYPSVHKSQKTSRYRYWANALVLQLLFKVRILCDTVMKCPLPCESYGSFKIPSSEIGTVGILGTKGSIGDMIGGRVYRYRNGNRETTITGRESSMM